MPNQSVTSPSYWLLTQSDYDDWEIVGLYSSEEEAIATVQGIVGPEWGGCGFRIDSLSPTSPSQVKSGEYRSVAMWPTKTYGATRPYVKAAEWVSERKDGGPHEFIGYGPTRQSSADAALASAEKATPTYTEHVDSCNTQARSDLVFRQIHW